MAQKRFEITTAPLQVEEVVKKVVNNRAGAVVTFIGTVREFTGDRQTLYLEYEAYEEMAEAKLAEIGQEVQQRWPEAKIAISHRVGRMQINDYSVVIAVATTHRVQAFEAGKYAIDRVKEVAPIWKKEFYVGGQGWVGSEKE
ncbi:MAG: molybdenum cofactor biosynthesis protein MoaE [Firmicutes bacterium]|nr:molybdenum cofactor biosynthesis protein MoaE [Bacillota bacterium]